MKRLCVFCGSSPGADPDYAEAARALGREFLRRGIGLVYGGGRVGLMYEIARVVHESRGEVIGVIPRGMVEKELAYTDVRDLRIVESMHGRKALMAEISDGFIALPGGLGTMEEFFEVLTWAQLGIHRKPCGLLNVKAYFDPVLAFLDKARALNFLQAEHRGMVLVDESPSRLLEKFGAYRPPEADMARWAIDLTKS
ncbi:MAG: TIGR00730 family Rossman fold protein [Candidatus Aminicenantes bacterium]|nr:TIGR00730 family Rossman fold protein [Candidatus Aminicenantes bacterium]